MQEVDLTNIPPYQQKSVATVLQDADKLIQGKIISSTTNDDLETTTLKFSNGATVILKSTNFKNDEILLRVFSKGGHSLVKDADYYSADNADQVVIQSGIGELSAVDLGNLLKGKNTRITPYIDTYSEGFTGNTISKETETLLQLLHLYFTSPRKDKEAFESFKTRQKQFYTNLIADPQVYFINEFQKTMSQQHPRAAHIPLPSDFDKISLDRSIQIYKERFANAGDFTFFLVGAFDEDRIKPLLEKYIGSLPGNAKKENFHDLGIRPPSGKVDKIITRGSEPKSVVQMIYNTIVPYNQQDAYTLQSLADLVNIKLVEKLREEKGSVYGVSATSSMTRIPYAYARFSIYFPCAPENVDTLTKAVVDELKNIITNGVSREDLVKVKEQQKRKLETDLKQNQFWMDALHEAYYLGNNPMTILDKQKNIDQLSSELIRTAAKKYINPDVYIRGVLKPETGEKPLKGF
jgi:zinc protease